MNLEGNGQIATYIFRVSTGKQLWNPFVKSVPAVTELILSEEITSVSSEVCTSTFRPASKLGFPLREEKNMTRNGKLLL